jgi:hypothetical protein
MEAESDGWSGGSSGGADTGTSSECCTPVELLTWAGGSGDHGLTASKTTDSGPTLASNDSCNWLSSGWSGPLLG